MAIWHLILLNSKALYAFPDRAITERARARCSLFVHAEWQIFVHLPLPRFMLAPLAKSRGITRALLLAFSIAFTVQCSLSYKANHSTCGGGVGIYSHDTEGF